MAPIMSPMRMMPPPILPNMSQPPPGMRGPAPPAPFEVIMNAMKGSGIRYEEHQFMSLQIIVAGAMATIIVAHYI